MNAQFDHDLMSSFYLWFQNHLVGSRMEAYTEGNANTFKFITGVREVPSSFHVYQGKYRQLVAEQSIDNPNSGIFVDGDFTSGDSPDLYIDYNNGRVLMPTASGSDLAITANNTVHTVNVYAAEDDEEQILFYSDFVSAGSPKLYESKNVDEKIYVLPACIVTLGVSENLPFSLGGEDDTQNRIRVVVVAPDNYTLDGVTSAFRDTAQSSFNILDAEDFPYGPVFDIKSFPFVYDNLSFSTVCSHIEKVNVSKITHRNIREKIGRNLQIAFLDFNISTYRYPRV